MAGPLYSWSHGKDSLKVRGSLLNARVVYSGFPAVDRTLFNIQPALLSIAEFSLLYRVFRLTPNSFAAAGLLPP